MKKDDPPSEFSRIESLLERIVSWEKNLYSPNRGKDSIVDIIQDIEKALTQLRKHQGCVRYKITWDKATGVNDKMEVEFSSQYVELNPWGPRYKEDFKEDAIYRAKCKAKESKTKNVKLWEIKDFTMMLLIDQF